MAKVTLKGEHHNNSKDTQDLENALDSGKYDEVFYEDREPMDDYGRSIFLRILYLSFIIADKVAFFQDTDAKKKRRTEYEFIESSLDDLYVDMSYLEKLQVIAHPLLFALFFIEWYNLGVSLISAFVTIAVYLIFVFHSLVFWVGIWNREEYMLKSILNSIEEGNEEIYAQIGSVHQNSLKKMLENSGVEVDPKDSHGRFQFTDVALSIISRCLTPIKSIKNIKRYYL